MYSIGSPGYMAGGPAPLPYAMVDYISKSGTKNLASERRLNCFAI